MDELKRYDDIDHESAKQIPELHRCITGASGSGICGAAAYCEEPVERCAACQENCNIRCGWIEEPIEQD